MDTNEQLEEFISQHLSNYKTAIISIIQNNTNALIDEDLASLIKQPPLDSMDIITNKLLSLAKKNKIIFDSHKLKDIILCYRKELLLQISDLKSFRNKTLIDQVNHFSPKRETELIQFSKEEINEIDQSMKKRIKKHISSSIKKYLIDQLDLLYSSNVSLSVKESIFHSFSKFMKNTYQKQLLENIDIKIMVKNRTLINGILEQGERYLFTKNNSHIFDGKKQAIL